MGKFGKLFSSRKFLASIVGGVVSMAGDLLGLDDTTKSQLVTIIIGYVVAQGWADSGKAKPADH
jgi:hypothetical protein